MKVAGVPQGFSEKSFDTGEVQLNYVEGPANGHPMLLVPSQAESWQGYKPVMQQLAKKYHVFVVDVRGHGKSSHTPGKYTLNTCGEDLKIFLEKVIQRPTIVCGCSSGGVLVTWLAANVSELVLAVISEDPALFLCVPSRMEKEPFMRDMFALLARTIGNPKGRDMAGFLTSMLIPQKGRKVFRKMPRWAARFVLLLFRANAWMRPREKYDVPLLPFLLRIHIKFFSEYDPDFSRATIDGSLAKNYDPDELLKKVKCPFMLFQSSWFRHEDYGLVGALDENDVAHVRELVSDLHYIQVESGHQIHFFKPRVFLREVNRFLDGKEWK